MSRVRIVDVVGALLALAAVACASVGALRAVGWQKRHIEHRAQLVAQRTKDLTTVEKHLQRLEEMLEERRSEAEAIDRRIPTAGQIGSFVEGLDKLANTRDIELLRLTTAPPRPHEVYSRTPVSLAFSGSFSNLHSFVGDLEHFERIVQIGETVIKRESDSGNCITEMMVYVFEQ
jgi:Tfp pilus assembly protein PilO